VGLNLFGKPRRRSRSTGSKGLDTVITIAAVGALGVGAYVVLSSGKGFGEAQNTVGRAAKNIVDAIDSTFDFIGGGSYKLQHAFDNDDVDVANREPDDIVGKLADAVGSKGKGYLDWYSKGVEREIQKNEDRSLINRKGIADAILGLGCGVIRKC